SLSAHGSRRTHGRLAQPPTRSLGVTTSANRLSRLSRLSDRRSMVRLLARLDRRAQRILGGRQRAAIGLVIGAVWAVGQVEVECRYLCAILGLLYLRLQVAPRAIRFFAGGRVAEGDE